MEKTSGLALAQSSLDLEARRVLTIQFFQGELFRLADKTENHDPRYEVQPGIETD